MDRAHPAGSTGEVIVVGIGGQQFAIDIMSVREIRGWTASTPLPGSPGYVVGMINLRGAVLPVVDLGARLGLGDTAPGGSSVVVVAQIHDRQVGLLVDAVEDILAVREDMLQATPDIGSGSARALVAGVMTIEACIVSLLSLDQVLPPELVEAA